MSDNRSTERRCCFCGRTERQAEVLIPSPTGFYICNFITIKSFNFGHTIAFLLSRILPRSSIFVFTPCRTAFPASSTSRLSSPLV